jgi:hypothetical protein
MSNGVGGGGDGRSTGGSEAKASQRFCFHDGDTRDGWQGGLSPIFFHGKRNWLGDFEQLPTWTCCMLRELV